MLTDIALILLVALLGNALFEKIRLPGILGMIVAGVVLGPSVADLIDPEVRDILAETKTVALIVILIRAGLGINKDTLNRIGGPAIRMGFVPGVLDTGLIDEVLTVANETAFENARLLARTEGIPGGISSGAAIAASIELAERDGMDGKRIVAILPSFAERYLSTALFDGIG